MTTTFSQWTVHRLETEIRRHNRLYFVAQAPEIPDVTFDRMVEALRRKAPSSPVLAEIGSDAGTTARAGVPHRQPMLSLDKCYAIDDLVAWGEKFSDGFIVMPKIDGVAMALRYNARGVLTTAATRGDGLAGEDVTENLRSVPSIPPTIPLHDIEARGEIWLPLSVFRSTYAAEFANPRNLAAGAIKLKDAAKTGEYRLQFLAYDLLGTDDATEAAKRATLARCGFATVPWMEVPTADGLRAAAEALLAQRAHHDFETDGIVVRANAVAEQHRVGSTAHHPRFAMAYKYQGDSALTTITDIVWSVSRNGTITPIALVEPVQLSGATVTRVSLHNYGLAKQLGVGKGARAIVMRRGGVIPHLESVPRRGARTLRAPAKCPSCGSRVRIADDIVYCTRPASCAVSRVGGLKHFVDAIACDGFGPKILEQLVEQGLVNDPADLYRLTVDELVTLDRMGETLATKLVEHMQARRQLPLELFLRALGIPELARQTARLLAGFGTLERVRHLTPTELEALHGVGPNITAAVVEGLKARSPLIDKLLRYVTIEAAAAERPGVLSGKTVLLTGSLATMQRRAAQQLVETHGGRVASGVSKQLDYLVVGADPGSKLRKARALIAGGAALQIVTEEEFLRLVQ